MRAVALALVASTLATSGCATRSTAGVAIGLGVVTAVTGVAIASGDGPEPAGPEDTWGTFDPDFRPVGRGIAVLGVALIAAGVISLAHAPADDAEAEADADLTATAPTADSSLDRDTLAAYEYARRGDCAAVAAIATGVRRADPTYYRDQFLRDPLLAPCLR